MRLDPWIEAQVANRESTLVRSADAAPYGLAEPEVWLHGLRNPWRFGFDLDAGLAFIPDVGRYHFEELNVVPLDQEAGNFGWPLAEAGECLVDCTAHDDLIWPILEYSQQDDRCAIMGGTTYRGAASPAWRRVYLFGDFCGGKIWALRDPGGHPELRLLIDSELTPVGFIRDQRGEILVVDGPQGALWRLRLPEDLGTGWRPAADVTAEMALATRRMGFSRTRALLEQARTDLFYMRASLRWRLTEPLVQLYNTLGRPLN